MGRKGKLPLQENGSKRELPSDKQRGSSNSSSHLPGTLDDSSSSEEALDSSKYSSRKLNCNWEKYDDDIGGRSEVLKGLDFSNFCGQQTTSGDSYFRFSSEKTWEVLEKFDDYFKLNVSNLSQEIMCIPLHERLKLESCFLTAEQIDIFNVDAKRNHHQLKGPLASTTDIEKQMLSLLRDDNEPKETTGWPAEEPTDKQSTWDSHSENFFSLSGVEEELDSILSLPAVQSNTLTSKQKFV